MILEEERIATEKERFKKQREFLEQQIKAGERYERLLSNSDFRAMLKDIEDALVIHEINLKGLDIELREGNSPFKINRIAMVRKAHLERMDQMREALQRPEALVEMAKQAREKLSEIKEQERELHA